MRVLREDLFSRIWSTPMRTLAPEFGISDVALRKACVSAGLPVPERGYWAKRAAGKKVVRPKLPAREPGRHPDISVGGNAYHPLTREELMGPLPEPPTFDQPIDKVEAQVRADLKKVSLITSFERTHPAVGKLLRADEARLAKQRSSEFAYSWDGPLFGTPFEKRRLRILNTLFLAVAKLGGIGMISDKEGRVIAVRVHDEQVRLRLDTRSNLQKSNWAPLENADPKALLILCIGQGRQGSAINRWSWEDGADRIESCLTEIAQRIILAAELQVREHSAWLHTWRVQERERLIEADRIAREAAAREERERLERLAQARVADLLEQAEALHRADRIRAYVDRIEARAAYHGTEPSVSEWAEWARSVADQIDPIVTNAFAPGLEY